MKKEEIEKVLDKIVLYLKTKTIEFKSEMNDGRVNSSINEIQIIDKLQSFFSTDKFIEENKYKINIPNIREWYDFAIEKKDDSNFFVPVNIKVSVLNTDNLNCKLGIFYSLTGMLPVSAKLNNEVSWEKFFISIDKYINSSKDKDYYFLVANKNDNKDYFWNSLKQLPSLVSNGNNLPFQANWALNRERINRTHEQAGEFILSAFMSSIYKRTTIRDDFDKYLKKHLEEYKSLNKGGDENAT